MEKKKVPGKPGAQPVRFVTRYWHYRAKKWMVASDYGYRAWRFFKKG